MAISFSSIFEMTYPEGLCFEDFSSTSKELIYFKSGRGYTEINGNTYPCHRQNLCYTRPGDRRNQFCESPMDYICIRFSGSDRYDEPETGVYGVTDPLFYSLFLDIKRESKEMKNHFHSICNLKITELLTYLVREIHDEGKDRDFYSLIKDIDTGHLFNMTISEMAEKVNCSPDHFRHKFKKITGSAPVEYLINKRIDYALDLLSRGQYNCSQISDLCGFSTPAQFSMIFKKKTGVSPRHYR